MTTTVWSLAYRELGPLHTRDCEPVIITLQALLLVEKGGTGLTSHYAWGTNGVSECKMDVKSAWISTWHWMYHVFMVTWIIIKNHLLEVGLIQNQETITFWTLTTVDLFYLIMWEDPVWIGIHWNSIWLKAQSHMTSHYSLRVRDHTTWFWRSFGTTFGHIFLGTHIFMVTALGSCVKWPLLSSFGMAQMK